jgi:uncharacterized OB-fold protein
VLTLKHFFEEARAGRLTGIRCGKCGELSIPPKQFCPGCQERDWTTVPLAGKGAITCCGDPRGAAGAERSPYAVAVVRLDEGVSLLGRVVDIPLTRSAPACPCASVLVKERRRPSASGLPDPQRLK